MKTILIGLLLICGLSLLGQSSQCPNRDHHSIPKAEKIVEAVLDQVGISMNIPILECPNIENALAVTVPTQWGRIRYIAYDYVFLKEIEYDSRTKWSVIFVFAHEVGHHLHDHTGSGHKGELEADKFAGFVLARMGASLKESIAGMHEIGSHHGSESHPPRDKRLQAIESGWMQGAETVPANNSKTTQSTTKTQSQPIRISPKRGSKVLVRTTR